MKRIYSQFITQHPAAIVLATVLIATLLAVFCRNLFFTIDYRIFFSDRNPELKTFYQQQRFYGSSDSIIFTIHNPDGNIFTEDIIIDLQALVDELKQLEYVNRVESIIDYPAIESDDSEIVIEAFLNDDVLLDEEILEQKRFYAINDNILKKGFISHQAETTLINIIFDLPASSTQAILTSAEAVRALEVLFNENQPSLETGLSGVIMLNAAFSEAGIHDLSTLIPLSALMVFLGLCIIFRSVLIGLLSLVYLGVSLLITLGISSLFAIPISVVSVSSLIIIISLSLAHCVHLTNTLLHMPKHEISHKTLVSQSLFLNMTPIFLTSLTTIASFLCLNFSDSPPYWHLGNMTAIGISIACITSLSFYPALLCFSQRFSKPKSPGFNQPLIYLSALINKQPMCLVLFLSFCAVLLISGVSQIRFNDQFIEYFSEDIDFRQDTDMLNTQMGGMYNIDYHIPARWDKNVLTEEYAEHIYSYTQWLRTQPEVRYVNSLGDTLSKLYEHLDKDIPDNRPTYWDEEKNNQYFLIYELSLPANHTLEHQLLVDKTGSKLTIFTKNLSSIEMQAFLERNRQWQSKHLPNYMQASPSGPAVMFAYISKRNISSMLEGTLASLLLISVLLLILLKSIKLSIISLLTNSLPILMMYGIAGYTLGELGMVGTTIAAATLGIVVDDTIHFLNKYQYSRKHYMMSIPQAIEYTLVNVGSAMTATTIILVMGMSVLLLSDFLLNYQAGLLTIITIVLALLFDLLLLPALIIISHQTAQHPYQKLKAHLQTD